MTLKTKVVLILLGVFAICGAVDFCVQRFIILSSFEEIERNEINEHIKRSVYAIEREIEHIDSFSYDWGAWDDTYAFIKTPYDDYIKSNLDFCVFSENNFNLIYICDTQGNVVYGKVYNLETEEEIHIEDFPEDRLPADHPLLQLNFENTPLFDTYVTGVMVTAAGPLIVASRPVITSSDEGPVRGFMIIGQILNDDIIQRLNKQAQVRFEVLNDTGPVGEALKDSPVQKHGSVQYAVEQKGEDFLYIYSLYPDIQGNPAFYVRATLARDIINGGYKAINYANLSLCVIGLIVILTVVFLMQRTVFRPISDLTQYVLSIGETCKFSDHLLLKRNDEVGALSREVGSMIEKVCEMNTVMETINDDLIEDINKRHKLEKALQKANTELERLATVDGLTQVSNRRGLDECMKKEWKRMMRAGTPLAFIICDVDLFKSYNDTWGHLCGDDCLRTIAEVIRSSIKRVSDFAGRYGGEEFAIILPDTDINGALHLAETIRMNVEKQKVLRKQPSTGQYVTISAGVSCVIPGKDNSEQMLIDLADKALYEAKENGRNRVVASSNQTLSVLDKIVAD